LNSSQKIENSENISWYFFTEIQYQRM
jgi:hypothetical protein